jgi:hypothetical protein
MTHPDSDRLTAWVHELVEPADAVGIADHVAECADCREEVDRLREEAQAVLSAIAPRERLDALKERLLREAGGPARRRVGGLSWQVPLAAAVLVGLVTVFLAPGPRHTVTAGRVELEDGHAVSAPLDLARSKSWSLRAVERSSVRLSDRSTVDLGAGAQMRLEGSGERGVQAELTSGEAAFTVAPGPRLLRVAAPAGWVESGDGKFTVRIVSEDEGGIPMKRMTAGALVIAFAGSVSVSNAQGRAPVEPGHAMVLAAAEAPLRVASPQDAEALLKRLEQLAARVAKLEDELTRLEARNTQLKDQLKAGGGGFGWGVNGAGGGVRVLQGAPGAAAPGSPIIIELEEQRNELKNPKGKEK